MKVAKDLCGGASLAPNLISYKCFYPTLFQFPKISKKFSFAKLNVQCLARFFYSDATKLEFVSIVICSLNLSNDCN